MYIYQDCKHQTESIQYADPDHRKNPDNTNLSPFKLSRSSNTMTSVTCGRTNSRKAYPPRTMYNLIVLILLQYLLTFAQGQGHGGDDVPVYEFTVEEGKPQGHPVGKIDTKAGLQYKFSDQPAEFTLDSATGEIRTATVIDREGLEKDTFELFVQSVPSASHLIEVRVTIVDINDNDPRFAEPHIRILFSENDRSGTQILLDTATDADIGENDVTDNYRIVSGNGDNNFRLVLFRESTKPLLYLENTKKLDREDKDYYQLRISAQDGGSPVRYGYLDVNVTVTDFNDNPPVFDESYYSAKVNETIPAGTSVIRVRATDEDAGVNADITYSIVNDVTNQFEVEPKTGTIRTRKRLTCQQSCDGNPECNPKSCVITVEARDNGQPYPLKSNAYISVNLIDENDHSPIISISHIPSSSSFSVVDEGAAIDTRVAFVSVTDEDEGLNGRTVLYITKGNELNHFQLDQSPVMTGLNIISVAASLDRERQSKYNLTILATDLGTPPRSSTAHLIIMVNDTNDHEPVFMKQSYSVSLSELSPVGAYVASLTATDNDTGINAVLSYQVISGNELGWFKINRKSGLVTTAMKLDRERVSRIVLRVEAKDGGSVPHRSRTNLTIHIWDENDETPVFEMDEYSVSVSESDPPTTSLITLAAQDSDEGRNGSVRYSFLASDNMIYQKMFQLDSTSGKITTLQKIDREIYPHIILHVIAKDQGSPSKSSTAVINVYVLDVNDNFPIFYPVQYSAQVMDGTPASRPVVQVTATDKDTGINAQLKYSITLGAHGKFTIDENTGWISTATVPQKQEKGFYRLSVTVQDQGENKLEARQKAVVEISVLDSSMPMPSCGKPLYSFTVQEDGQAASVGRNVGRLEGRSAGVSQPVTYTITGGDPFNVFDISRSTGTITTAKSVDREKQKLYSLEVTVKSGTVSVICKATINISDLNDNGPSFPQPSAEVTVPENLPMGHEVYHAYAKDPDSEPNAQVRYALLQGGKTFFTIGENTGLIKLFQPLIGSAGQVMSVKVNATDSVSPYFASQLNLRIKVMDVNDHSPVFEQSNYELSIEESRSVNSQFYTVTARDPDLGPNGQVTYTITGGNQGERFGIFPDGVLYVAKGLDREGQSLYHLTVKATDAGTPNRSSVVNVTIHLLDSNDNAPVFANQTYTFSVEEDCDKGTYVGCVAAFDADIGRSAELTFKIDQTQNFFSIHPKTGIITTMHKLDRESIYDLVQQNFYTLPITVSDNGSPKLTSSMTVTIDIIDVNDNPPVFTQTFYETSVSEDEENSKLVTQVYATDADTGENAKITYSIVDGDNGKFSIGELSGKITLAGGLDRESQSEYMLTVVATDGGNSPFNRTAEVKIKVTDYNDNPPVFAPLAFEPKVNETARIGEFIIQAAASDKDFGNNGVVKYAIIAGNPGTMFSIDSNTGKIYLAAQLDYEKTTQYELNITATDLGSPALAASLLLPITVLDANDNPPKFPSDPIVKQVFEELQVGTPVLKINATDADSGFNKLIKYSILRQIPRGNHYDIDEDTGLITVTDRIDREVSDNFKILVEATDQALPKSNRRSAQKLVTVILRDINDNGPHFVSMKTIAVVEGTSPQAKLGQVVARDVDLGLNGKVTYELTGGDLNRFRIESNTGTLFLNSALSQAITMYEVTITASDQGINDKLGPKSSVSTVTIFVRSSVENGPVFTQSSYSGEISESKPPGTSILTMKATAPQGLSNVEYFVTSVTSNSVPQDQLFTIDRFSGVLSVAQELDREKGYETFQVEVYAVSQLPSRGPLTRSIQVQITLTDTNDSPPIFSPSSLEVEVDEDAQTGFQITMVTATDPDQTGVIEYSISRGNDGRFTVDSVSGALKVNKPLDREEQAVYALQVTSYDGVHRSYAEVKVIINDVNDEKPVFDKSAYYFMVPEDSKQGTTIGRVSAQDDDAGHSGDVTYSIVTKWGQEYFWLHPTTGIFSIQKPVEYEEVPHYILTIKAEDRGPTPLSSTVTVYMNIDDTNDNEPIFDPGTYSDEVMENATVGTHILTVAATDRDSGKNGKILYSLVGGDPRGQFRVDPETGALYTAKELDREAQAYYNLAVTATDQPENTVLQRHSTAMVSVIVKDVNDQAPVFVSPNIATVSEAISKNTPFFKVTAKDTDELLNGQVTYRLRRNPGSLFQIDPTDGTLRVMQALNREIIDSYTITVAAIDKGQPAKSTEVELKVKVMDENDNSPRFNPSIYSHTVHENVKVGTTLLTVTASDQDAGLNAELRYFITADDENRDFYLDPLNGELRVQKRLDYERKKVYNIEVTAQDLGEPSRSDTAIITVTIEDVNDCSPIFVDSPYVAYVQENMKSLPVHVLTVSASDADSEDYASLVYSIEEGDQDLFQVDHYTGEVQSLQILDREQHDSYRLTIIALDSGNPGRTGTATVDIHVRDANDNTPVFSRSHYVVHVPENKVQGAPVVLLHATDKDTGKNAEIRYDVVGSSEDFKVDSDSGQISLITNLDREIRDNYSFDVMATDHGTISRSTTAKVTVIVDDVNEFPPVFENSVYNVYIRNPTASGSFVLGVTATDQDSGMNADVMYSLSGPSAASFKIDSLSGVITAVSGLGSGVSKYQLTAKAQDKGDQPLSSEATINIEVLPEGTSGFPEFLSGPNTFSIKENVTVGHVFTTVKATSARAGVTLTYRIAGGNVGKAFTVSTEGHLKINSALDFETTKTYTLWLEAKDDGTPGLTDYQKITVNVEDVNDNDPVFEQTFYQVNITEEGFPPEDIIKVKATDADARDNGHVSYSLTEGNIKDVFVINSRSGMITTNGYLDRETLDHYTVTVLATDNGDPRRSSSVFLEVNVKDKNDERPHFSQHFITRISENSPLGSLVLVITSTDKDIGVNAQHTYTLTTNPGNKFHVDPASGRLTVAGVLDREKKDVYILQVAADDGAHQTSTPVTIDILDANDEYPIFKAMEYEFEFLAEQPEGALVGKVQAEDKDAKGPNSEIFYLLEKASEEFYIDSISGEIKSRVRVHYSTDSTGNRNTYTLSVIAKDRGEPSLSSQVKVTVNLKPANQHPPVFEEENYVVALPENAAMGRSVVTVTAKDTLDTGINSEIKYILDSGNGLSLVSLNPDSGEMTLTASLQGQTGNTYTIKVRAEDKGQPPKSAVTTVTVSVARVNRYSPVFIGSGLAFQTTVPENRKVGMVIARVSATDQDVGVNGQVSYHITGGDTEYQFEIDPNQGNIKIAKSLDYEVTPVFYLNITARDRGLIPREVLRGFTVFVTDVNDNPPTFSSDKYLASVYENVPSSTPVLKLNATDADSTPNARIEYSLVEGSDKFSIDRNSGLIKTIGQIDYEQQKSYDLTVKVFNPGTAFAASTTVVIQVLSVNEYPPIFAKSVYEYRMSESAKPESIIGAVEATDKDLGDDGIIEYYLVGDSNNAGFSIQHDTGEIFVENMIDRETTSYIALHVLAKNHGPIAGGDTSRCQVRISVRDANDPPVFKPPVYEASIPENSRVGKFVTRVSAVDNDLRQDYKTFLYRILSGNNGSVFNINAVTGEIRTVADGLDRETIPVYNLVVGAVDQGKPPKTGSATVRVRLSDVNDKGPFFKPSKPQVTLPENRPPYADATDDLTSFTYDPDVPPNQGPYKYRLLNGTSSFDIEESTGVVKAKVTLDHESRPSYDLSVEVSDGGSPTMTSTLVFTVKVGDTNDSPSSARSVKILVKVYNGRFNGGLVGNIHPTDKDTVGDYSCRIINGNRQLFFLQQGCNLHSRTVGQSGSFVINATGHDGKHSSVPSNAEIEFSAFTKADVENSIEFTVDQLTGNEFVEIYTKFIQAFKDILGSTSSPHVISIQESGNSLKVVFSVKDRNRYVPRNRVELLLRTSASTLKTLTGHTIKSLHPEVCKSNPCLNGGRCQSQINVSSDYSSFSSTSFILTVPKVQFVYQCKCRAGFTGRLCNEISGECTVNLCQNSGSCVSQGTQTQCVCTDGWTGESCERNLDECLDFPCKNGGTCTDTIGSFRCSCRSGYSGALCEESASPCNPSPCQNGGTCSVIGKTFECACRYGFTGPSCEISSPGFGRLSYMEYNTVIHQNRSTWSFEFATTKSEALLVYSLSTASPDYILLEIINKFVTLTYSVEGVTTSLSVLKSVTDGNWYKMTLNRIRKVTHLTVVKCPDGQDTCDTCRHGDTSCSNQNEASHSGILRLNAPLFIGGIKNFEELLTSPAPVRSHDFIGCMRNVKMDDVNMFRDIRAISQRGISDQCPREAPSACAAMDCGKGQCVDEWSTQRCECDMGIIGDSCDKEVESFGFGPDATVEYRVREDYRRNQLLKQSKRQKRAAAPGDSTTIMLKLRTSSEDGVLVHVATARGNLAMHVMRKHFGVSQRVGGTELLMELAADVSDGAWHTVTLTITESGASLSGSDGQVVNTEGNWIDPLGTDVTQLTLGAPANPVHVQGTGLSGLRGCVSEFKVNGKPMPFSGRTDQFVIVQKGTVQEGCEGIVAMVSSQPEVPLAVIIVIVVFVVILVAILVAFMVIKMRRKKKAKTAKQNAAMVLSTNGLMGNKTNNDSGRSHQDSGFTENAADLSEEDIIRQHIADELAANSFNEREVTDRPTPARPDIIAPETRAPAIRQSPISLPDSGSDENNRGIDNNGFSEGPPDYYDIDNASSIAPSDLADVVGHYRKYRKGTLGHPEKEQGSKVPPAHYRQSPNFLGVKQHHLRYQRDSPSLLLGNRDSPNMMTMQSTPLSNPSPLPNGAMRNVPPRHTHSPAVTNQMHHRQSPYGNPMTPGTMNQLSRRSPANMLSEHMQASPANIQSMRSTPIFPSNTSTSSTSSRPQSQASVINSPGALPNGHGPGSRPASRPSRPSSSLRDPVLGYRATPTKGLTVEEVARLNSRYRPSLSSADVLSSSSEEAHGPNINQTDFTYSDLLEPSALLEPPESTTEDSSNDSFTCSEVDYDNDRLRAFNPSNIVAKLNSIDLMPPSHKRTFSGSDTTSTLPQSEDDVLPPRGRNGTFNMEYFANWGSNFDKLVGVFKDIALLPDNENSKTDTSLLNKTSVDLSDNTENFNRTKEEYV